MARGCLVESLVRIVPQEAISKWWTEGMQQLFCSSFKDAFCQAQKCTAMIGPHNEDPTFAQCQQAPTCCARAQFCEFTNGCAHIRGGVRLESIETGAEKEKGTAQRRSSIPPGRENVAAMEKG